MRVWINNPACCSSMAALALAIGLSSVVGAADKTVKIGITMPLTGADAETATRIKDGALLAIEEAGQVAGYQIVPVVLDNGTATAGQYDLAQAATNTKRLISDPEVVANIGPQMSGEGQAMAPILSEANLATISPASTNPDLTDPALAEQFRPKGKVVYFRTVTTDAIQGPGIAHYFATTLGVKSVYVLDDSGAYGVGLADAFERQAKKEGVNVLGHDQLNPRDSSYASVLTKIKAAAPDAIYFGGSSQAGVKLVKQAYDIIPNVIKGGGSGVYGSEILKGGGFPAAQGWYATIAAPHLTEQPALQEWVDRYKKRFGIAPNDNAVTAYDAALIVLDGIKRVAESGKEADRSTIRDAIQTTTLKTLQGEVRFDVNGDLTNRAVSLFQVQQNTAFPLDDVVHQFKYVGGVAPPVDTK
jgi:branched-chain amino acid transport system substrate-binding protein